VASHNALVMGKFARKAGSVTCDQKHDGFCTPPKEKIVRLCRRGGKITRTVELRDGGHPKKECKTGNTEKGGR